MRLAYQRFDLPTSDPLLATAAPDQMHSVPMTATVLLSMAMVTMLSMRLPELVRLGYIS